MGSDTSATSRSSNAVVHSKTLSPRLLPIQGLFFHVNFPPQHPWPVGLSPLSNCLCTYKLRARFNTSCYHSSKNNTTAMAAGCDCTFCRYPPSQATFRFTPMAESSGTYGSFPAPRGGPAMVTISGPIRVPAVPTHPCHQSTSPLSPPQWSLLC